MVIITNCNGRHYRLERAFQEADTKKEGGLEMGVWQQALEDTLRFGDVDWTNLGLDIPKTAKGDQVDYKAFLDQYSVRVLGSAAEGDDAEGAPEEAQGAMSAIYGNYDFLKAIAATSFFS